MQVTVAPLTYIYRMIKLGSHCVIMIMISFHKPFTIATILKLLHYHKRMWYLYIIIKNNFIVKRQKVQVSKTTERGNIKERQSLDRI